MTIICVCCNKQFELKPNVKYMKYCSIKCRNRYYYLQHREKRIQQAKEWQKLNPEKTRKSMKKARDKFRKEKPERFNELMRMNYQRNKAKYMLRNRHNAFLTHHPDLKQKLLSKCEICGSLENIELHHLDYINCSLDKANVKVLCRKCHRLNHK